MALPLKIVIDMAFDKFMDENVSSLEGKLMYYCTCKACLDGYKQGRNQDFRNWAGGGGG